MTLRGCVSAARYANLGTRTRTRRGTPRQRTIMNHPKMRTVAAAGAVAAALAAAAFGAPGSAHADAQSFMHTATADGFTDDVGGANVLHNGYMVCNMLNLANGKAVADHIYADPNMGFVTYAGAEVFVWDAVNELCPWQNHNGSAKSVRA